MNIYIKRINTNLSPKYISLGNQGDLVIVLKEYREHHREKAVYKLFFDDGRLEGSLFHSLIDHKIYCEVSYRYQDQEHDLQIEVDTVEEGLTTIEELLVEALTEHRDIIEMFHPDLYQQEGQLLLFEGEQI